jgi:hypothetical protein
MVQRRHRALVPMHYRRQSDGGHQGDTRKEGSLDIEPRAAPETHPRLTVRARVTRSSRSDAAITSTQNGSALGPIAWAARPTLLADRQVKRDTRRTTPELLHRHARRL